jgi:mannitol-1-phosphate 5-dehydrogenase
LNERNEYTIQLADESQKEIHVANVDGLNNQTNPEAVIDSVSKADIVTTAIGPNILPFIAELIAKGIQKRRSEGNMHWSTKARSSADKKVWTFSNKN